MSPGPRVGTADAIQLATQFGASGAFVVYLIWRETAERKERREQEARREAAQERDIASREKLASALTNLSIVVQGKLNV